MGYRQECELMKKMDRFRKNTEIYDLRDVPPLSETLSIATFPNVRLVRKKYFCKQISHSPNLATVNLL